MQFRAAFFVDIGVLTGGSGGVTILRIRKTLTQLKTGSCHRTVAEQAHRKK
jgi:hypothetical protein